jgi:serine/threonine protein kinase
MDITGQDSLWPAILVIKAPLYAGSLTDCIANRNDAYKRGMENIDASFGPRTKDEVFADILEGIIHLHSIQPNPISHRDLKPDNVLRDEKFVFKVSDFGLSRVLADSGMTNPLGTLPYAAPEQMDKKTRNYTEKVDIYALGMTLFELNYPCRDRHTALKAMTNLEKAAKVGDMDAEQRLSIFAQSFATFPANLSVLITQMTRNKAVERPSASDLLPLFKHN